MPVGILPPEDAAARDVEERLRDLAARFPPALRERVNRLLFGAAESILQLAEVDLVRFESGSSAGSHTLALWEELAPVMSETVESVNRLVAVAEQRFRLRASAVERGGDRGHGLRRLHGPAARRRPPG